MITTVPPNSQAAFLNPTFLLNVGGVLVHVFLSRASYSCTFTSLLFQKFALRYWFGQFTEEALNFNRKVWVFSRNQDHVLRIS